MELNGKPIRRVPNRTRGFSKNLNYKKLPQIFISSRMRIFSVQPAFPYGSMMQFIIR